LVFLNGVQAAPAADWTDAEVLLPCSAPSSAALHPGHNVLAIHCFDADGGGTLGASLCVMPNPNQGWALLIEEFSQMITNQPQRSELYLGRANALVRCGRRDEAVQDLAKAVELKPTSAPAWYGLAPLLLELGQQPAFLQRRREALTRFANPHGPSEAERIARIALLTPADGGELDSAASLADRAASANYADAGLPDRQLTESLAQYRRGQYADCVTWSGKVLTSAGNLAQPGWTHERARNRTAEACLIQAMAYWKLQEPDNARSALAKGLDFVQAELPDFDAGDLGREWPDCLIVNILLREAKATVL
jgi:tetratricopeptide (TPR) repeat protein